MINVKFKDRNAVIVGIGNSFKSDESVGLYIANNLDDDDIMVLSSEYRFEDCIEDVALINPDLLVVVDAADFDGRPGEIKQFTHEDIRNNKIITNQDFPVEESIDILIEKMKELEVVILGIKGATKKEGEELSPHVKKAAERIITYFTGVE